MNRSARNLSLVALGVAMTAFARRVVAAGERLAFENSGEVPVRATTIPAARAEGVAATAIGLRGRFPSGSAPLFVAVGIASILAPQAVLRASLRVAYRDASRVRPKAWVVPATRVVGVAHLLVAARIRRQRAPAVDGRE